jgi:hypothetical protein
MTEQVQQNSEQNPQEQQNPEEAVTISKSELDALRNQIQELQAYVMYVQQGQQQQQQQVRAPEITPRVHEPDYDSMSQRELVDHIKNQMLAPIVQTLVLQQVQQEIQATRAKYPDFDMYREDVRLALQANPMMSVEDAYILVKSKKPKPQTQTQKAESEPKPRTQAEKPKVSTQTTQEAPPEDLAEAAQRALEELGL